MDTAPLDETYWRARYLKGDTPWDIGCASPALVRFCQALPHKQVRILIPGAGFAHEAEWLWRHGFRNTFVCDWVEAAFAPLRQRVPDFPAEQMLVRDFFALEDTFDLILEQTFFCALPPARRPEYVRQCARLLPPGGVLAGLLFASHFPFQGPPFGGTEATYRRLLPPCFKIEEMALTPHSIAPRRGNELFFKALRTHVPCPQSPPC